MNDYMTIWGFVKELINTVNELKRSEDVGTSFLDARDDLKRLLKAMHEFLLSKTSDRNAYFAVFPIVAHIDECMESCTRRLGAQSWISLQGELFEISDAGTLFYQYIDYFRGRNDIPVVVYEVFYFCLKDGFKGSMIEESEIRMAYLEELKAHIPVEPIPKIEQSLKSSKKSYPRVPVWSYYASVILLILIVRESLKLLPLTIDVN